MKEPELTKREYFAVKAMEGLLSNSKMGDADLHDSAQEWVSNIAEASVGFADKLIEELEES